MSLWTVVAGLALGGCVDTYQVSGRQLEIEADGELAMCAGTLEHMDRFVERFAAELGLPLTGEPWLSFRWMTTEHFAERNPCAGMPACAVVRTVYASEIPHEHEIVHAAASDLGLAHPFFIEGLAVAYEGGTRDARPGDDEPQELDVAADGADTDTGDDGDEKPPPRSVLAALRESYIWLPGEYYPLAGAFTRYLIDRFGLRLHLEFYRRTWYADQFPALARQFHAVFGTTLEEAALAFEAERGDCSYAAYRFKLLECESPEVAWDGERLARYFTLDCDDPAAMGQLGVSVRTVHSFEVAEAGRFRLELRSRAGMGLTIGSCGGCERQAIVRLQGDNDMRELELPPGRYFMRADTAASQPVDFGVMMERMRE